MKTAFAFSLALSLLQTTSAQINQVPIISNLSATIQQDGSMTILYDVSDAENDPLEIIVQVSDDGGYSYLLTATLPAPTGHVGFPVSPGTAKSIHIANGVPLSPSVKVRVTALDRQPMDIAALVARVDSTKLKQRLGYVEGIRHRTAGLAHLTAVADSIKRHFNALNLGLKEGNFAYGNYTARNLIGNSTGYAEPDQTVIVDAHYDSVNNAPGADDNGTGVAGMLEVAAILAPYPSKKGLRFIGFDLEETGLTGSIHYVNNLAPSDNIAGVFNLEMIGYYDTTVNSQNLPSGFNQLFPAAYNEVVQDGRRGNFITNVGNTASQSLVDVFRTAAQTYVPNLKVIDLVTPGVGALTPDLTRSDHAPFWNSGRKALMLTDGANFRNPNYHTPNDKATTIHYGFMQQVTQATLAAAATLSGVQHGSWKTAQATISVGVEPTDALPCLVRAYRSGDYAVLNIGQCDWAEQEARIQILNAEGRVIIEKQLSIHAQSEVLVPNISPAGSQILFLRLSNKRGELLWSGKF